MKKLKFLTLYAVFLLTLAPLSFSSEHSPENLPDNPTSGELILSPAPSWKFYFSTSPIADLRARPNLSGESVIFDRFTLGLKASLFLDANEVYGIGFQTRHDGQMSTARAKGFEIGPQFGYLLSLPWNLYFKPRLGIYRSIVHYSGGNTGCNYPAGVNTACTGPDPIQGWVVEAMGMVHAPVYGPIDLEIGTGFSTQNILFEIGFGFRK